MGTMVFFKPWTWNKLHCGKLNIAGWKMGPEWRCICYWRWGYSSQRNVCLPKGTMKITSKVGERYRQILTVITISYKWTIYSMYIYIQIWLSQLLQPIGENSLHDQNFHQRFRFDSPSDVMWRATELAVFMSWTVQPIFQLLKNSKRRGWICSETYTRWAPTSYK